MNDIDNALRHACYMGTQDRLEKNPILFAHRGGKAMAPENTIEAFQKALTCGSNALESDAWVTKCGHVVLHHDPRFGPIFKRRRINKCELSSLPSSIPTLQSFYSKIVGTYDFSIDIKDEKAAKKVIEVSNEYSFPLEKLWMCHPSIEKLTLWRDLNPTVRLVNSTKLESVKEGPERRIATLSQVGIDAFNMHFSEWNEALVALCHRFRIRSFAWDAQEERQINWLLGIGIDGIFSDHVERMNTALWNYGGGN